LNAPVYSHGLIEHYVGETTKACFEKHAEFIKNEGYGMILAPAKGKEYGFLIRPLVKILGLDVVLRGPARSS